MCVRGNRKHLITLSNSYRILFIKFKKHQFRQLDHTQTFYIFLKSCILYVRNTAFFLMKTSIFNIISEFVYIFQVIFSINLYFKSKTYGMRAVLPNSYIHFNFKRLDLNLICRK